MKTESQRRAQKEYQKKRPVALLKAQKRYNAKCRVFKFRFNPDVDGDLIDFLERHGNMTDYIRELIRMDMMNQETML